MCIILLTTPVLHVFEHKAECYIQLTCTIEIVQHNTLVFQQIFRVHSIHGKIVNSVSPILHLTVNQKIFSRFKFFFQAIVISVPITCSTSTFWAPDRLSAPFPPSMFSLIVKAMKDFVTCFAFMNNPSSCFRVFLGNVINHFSLRLCRKVGARRARKNSAELLLLCSTILFL